MRHKGTKAMRHKVSLYAFVPLCLIFLLISPIPVRAQEPNYQQIPGAIHIHTIQNNEYMIEELAEEAKKLGIKVLVLTDHDLVKVSYGIFPFRNIIKYSIERPSVIKLGVEKYLKSIDECSKNNPNLILVPGVESLPFYYVTGSYFKKDLTFHDIHKHLLFVGIKDPEVYKKLPLLDNGFSKRYTKYFLFGWIPFIIGFVLSLVLIYWGGYFRKTADG